MKNRFRSLATRRAIIVGTSVTVAASLVAAGIGVASIGAAATELHGAGTTASPYLIANAADFASFVADVNADTAGTGAAKASFTLSSDVVLTTPVTMITSFSGVLNGAGHTIFGLTVDFSKAPTYVNSSNANRSAALIYKNTGTVTSLGLSGVKIEGTASAETSVTLTKKASLAVINQGLVDQVYVVGSVDGGWRSGGIVAENNAGGTVRNSYFRGSVHGSWETGAIVARNDSAGVERITNVYADATVVSDTRNVGLISGYSYSTATISGAVALSGSVAQASGQSAANIGRINGQDNTSVGSKGATYANNLALGTMTLSGAVVSGGTANSRQGLPKTAAELAQQSTFAAIGWDFSAVWAFSATDKRPELATVPEKTTPDVTPTEPETPAPGPDLSAAVATTSPDGQTTASVFTTADGALGYTVTQNGATVVRDSDLGLVIGGTDWGTGVTLGAAVTSSTDISYPLIGTKDSGRDYNNTSVIPLTRGTSSLVSVELQVFNTGIALRYVLDSSLAGAVVARENTTFEFDPASMLNYQVTTPSTIDDLQNSFSRNVFAAAGAQSITVLPTVEIPDGHFANITEANVLDWPAIALKTTAGGAISTYYWATDNGLGTFVVKPTTLHSPYRVVTLASNLTDLTNSDIVTAVNDPMDPTLFPGGDTSWIKPGTNSWSTLSTNDQTYSGIEGLIDSASLAGIPGVLIEGNITDASWGANTSQRFAKMAALAQHGKAKAFPVSVWLWSDFDKAAGVDSSFTSTVGYTSGSPYPQVSLQNPDLRAAYLDLVASSGIAGLKVDHTFDETETKVNFFRDFAKDSASRRLMVIYHNPLEPTGQERTFPNELGREAIKGLQSGYDANQNVVAPFTRLVAGTADYTPLLLSGAGGNVSWTHQLASTVIYSMPYLQLSERPAYIAPGGQYHGLLGSVVANLPTTWKKSWVLPQSKIGSVAALVRQTSDGEYWIAVTGGTTAPGELAIPLSFLPANTTYNIDLYTDKIVAAGMDRTTTTATSATTLTPTLRSGGGFLARITTDAIDNPLVDDGTSGPFTLATEADLALIAQHPSATFTVTADIRMTAPWTPVANFDGTINGNGHTISGLTVAGTASKAFIVTNSGTIRQLGFADATSVVTGAYVQTTRVAVVTVTNNGLIDQVFVNGATVSGGWRTAPIAAENSGEVRNSYTVGATVVSNWETGGLVGWNSATAVLKNNYVVAADVTAAVQNGGILAGYGYTGTTVTGNVVVSGKLQTANDPRARILARENGTPTYLDNLSVEGATVNGVAIVDGTTTNRNGGNRTAAQLATRSTYEAIGWNFAATWTFDDQLGRPTLTAVPETIEEPQAPTTEQLVVVVPKPGATDPGEFVWNIDGGNAVVDLGEAQPQADSLIARGAINPIRVTDTRSGAPVWSISAQTSDFTAGSETVLGKYLGWTPKILSIGGGAVAGVSVVSGFDGGDGLSASSTLGAAVGGHALGSATLGADLVLKLPLGAAEGTYQATLTLTALG